MCGSGAEAALAACDAVSPTHAPSCWERRLFFSFPTRVQRLSSQVIDSLRKDPRDPLALTFVKGDFFKPLPKELAGVDAVIMKFIMHHW